MAIGEWRRIAGTALSNAPIAQPSPGPTGPPSKINAWCGLALDPRDSTLYCAANGGGFDYAGNEVDSLRLADNAPAWIERRVSSAPIPNPNGSAHYPDGRPASRHSYYGVAFSTTRNRVLLAGGARWSDSQPIAAMDGFDITRNDWDPAGTFPDAAASLVALAQTVFVDDAVSGDLFAFGNSAAARWSSATNTWSTPVQPGVVGNGAATAFDTKRGRILVIGGIGPDSAQFTVATNTAQPVTFTGPAAAKVAAIGAGCGLVYESQLDAFLLCTGAAGAEVIRIDAATWSATVLATQGGAGVPAAVNGVWRRFLYVPKLQGVAYVPAYSSEVWFLRTA